MAGPSAPNRIRLRTCGMTGMPGASVMDEAAASVSVLA